MPRIFASSILSKNAQEAIAKINASEKFTEVERSQAIRIIKKLFSSKSKRLSTEEAAESRIDYISDQLGIHKDAVIRAVELMREEQILANAKDLTAFVKKNEVVGKTLNVIEKFRTIEERLIELIDEGEKSYNYKELNEALIQSGIKDCTLNNLKVIINFWSIKNWIKRSNLENSRNHIRIVLTDKEAFSSKMKKRHFLAKTITEYLHKTAEAQITETTTDDVLVEFSVQELKEQVESKAGLFTVNATLDDIEDTLFYLSRIEAIKIEGGFLVVHNKLTIERLEKNNRTKYKESDYENLRLFYQQKVQQIHIVGEYAKKMIRNYNEALQFVDDYFSLNYSSFLSKYFPGSRQTDIKRTLTPEKFMRLFGALSPAQLNIINDSSNQYIVVAAGPGSGKTRLLVHKLASLLLAEDVKHEQLLMLTFSRAAATEFKKRLIDLIGNAANYIEIKTFHSYCFDLLGRVGSLSDSKNIVASAVENINSGQIEPNRITKTVLVIDEAQDMNQDEYNLVKALINQNDEMRVILVGDDDQNIYGFRGSDSQYMQSLISEYQAVKYELTENYRSKENLVALANRWAATISKRLKTENGYPIQQSQGTIQITQYANRSLVVPLSEQISKAELTGSTCILTKTNEDAALITGTLSEKGIPSKLIQSNDGFNLGNLYELRYFTDLTNRIDDEPSISEHDWEAAKRALNAHIAGSSKKDLVNEIISAFEQINTEKKYKSDWKAFLFESKIEDFTSISSEIVYTSTIHKAKGKEFDNVYILLRDFAASTDEERRQVYVAITRSKNNLSIHYNSNFLKPLAEGDISYLEDSATYPEPQQIVLYLTHRDVQLGYFAYVQHRMNTLQSGSRLQVMKEGLSNLNGDLLCKYSKKFQETLDEYFQKGYSIVEANVSFLLYWKNESNDTETKIILPVLRLSKLQTQT
jgi:ATP-dependent DNA helicase RecQ